MVRWSRQVRAALNPIVGIDRVSRFFVGVHRKGGSSFVLTEINGAPGAVVRDHRGIRVISVGVNDGLISGVFLVLNPDKVMGLEGVDVPS